MKNILLILILFSFSNYSCNTSKKAQSNKDKIMITFDKKSGRGISPTYSVEIHEDGKIIYRGVKNADKIGMYRKIISNKEIKNLKQKFVDADFFKFNDEYTSMITDLPTTYISFSNKDNYKKIRDYYGSPKKLKDLEKMIESIVNEDGWIKVD